MADQEAPKNRRERRAAAKEAGKPVASATSTPKIKMGQPDRSGPKGKTLMDIYEEKRDLLDEGQPFDSKYQDGKVRDESGNILDAGLDGEPLGPMEQAVFWSIVLSMLHFTLDVLVYNQYRQEIEWWPIWTRTFTVFPVLFLMLYILRGEMANRLTTIKQLFFLVLAAGGGCYMIHIGNTYDYFAVMKQAPPVGTLWVWSVIEMNLPYAVASIVVNLTYLFWKGYSMF